MATTRPRKDILTPEDYEIMMYWVGVYNAEIERAIKVVNYMQAHPIPKSAHKLVQLELPFDTVEMKNETN